MVPVLLVWQLYYSDDILKIDIQTDPIQHLPIKKTQQNESQVYRFSIQNTVLVFKFEHLPAVLRTPKHQGLTKTKTWT